MLTTTRMVEKVIGNQAKGKALKGSSTKTLAVDVDMVGFIPNRFWIGIDQPNSFIRDVLAKVIEWVKLFKDTTREPIVM